MKIKLNTIYGGNPTATPPQYSLYQYEPAENYLFYDSTENSVRAISGAAWSGGTVACLDITNITGFNDTTNWLFGLFMNAGVRLIVVMDRTAANRSILFDWYDGGGKTSYIFFNSGLNILKLIWRTSSGTTQPNVKFTMKQFIFAYSIDVYAQNTVPLKSNWLLEASLNYIQGNSTLLSTEKNFAEPITQNEHYALNECFGLAVYNNHKYMAGALPKTGLTVQETTQDIYRKAYRDNNGDFHSIYVATKKRWDLKFNAYIVHLDLFKAFLDAQKITGITGTSGASAQFDIEHNGATYTVYATDLITNTTKNPDWLSCSIAFVEV